jgi:hypothetical protein
LPSYPFHQGLLKPPILEENIDRVSIAKTWDLIAIVGSIPTEKNIANQTIRENLHIIPSSNSFASTVKDNLRQGDCSGVIPNLNYPHESLIIFT